MNIFKQTDSLSLMATLDKGSVDLVLTDPPYIISHETGFKNVKAWEDDYAIGLGIHEMGTARMGRDPKTSVLNEWNQMHDVKNIFITDGACMTSAACQNPSLTYMALTARAANYAVEELKRQNL